MISDIVEISIQQVSDNNEILATSSSTPTSTTRTKFLSELIHTKLRYLGGHLLYLVDTHHYPGHSIEHSRLNNNCQGSLKDPDFEHSTLGYLGPGCDHLDTYAVIFGKHQYFNPLTCPKLIEQQNTLHLTSDIEVFSDIDVKFTFNFTLAKEITLATGHLKLSGSDINNWEVEGKIFLHRHNWIAGEPLDITLNNHIPVITKHLYIPYRKIDTDQ